MATALGITRLLLSATIFFNVESVVPEITNMDTMVADALPASSHSANMNIAVPVRNSNNSSALARSSKKPRLEAATVTAALMQDKVLNVTHAAVPKHLSPEIMAFQKALQQAMRTK